MRVLVAYASRHGSTRGIAERIGGSLRSAGIDADVAPVGARPDPRRYDAVVVGGAAYMFHWLKEATAFVRRHRAALSGRPVWTFSSGPLGTDTVDAQGRDVREACIPREIPALDAEVGARGHRVFYGAFDPTAKPIGLAERVTRMMPAARDAMPKGDFRDWDDIDAWTRTIALELKAAESSRGENARGV